MTIVVEVVGAVLAMLGIKTVVFGWTTVGGTAVVVVVVVEAGCVVLCGGFKSGGNTPAETVTKPPVVTEASLEYTPTLAVNQPSPR
jgi:hypothetical protein